MYRIVIALVVLLLANSVHVFAQGESSSSGKSSDNPSTKDDEAHLRNELRKLDTTPTVFPTELPTKIPPTNTPPIAPVPPPGDANEDFRVDEADFTIWHTHYKQSVTDKHTSGDFNNDGVSDGIDYTIWLANRTTATSNNPK